jgi:hypothetical protein
MPLHPPSWSPNQHVATSVHEHGIVFLDAVHGQLFTSNRIGSQVWQLIERGLSVERIAEALSHDHHVALSVARTHTIQFIAQLEAQRLIARRSSC